MPQGEIKMVLSEQQQAVVDFALHGEGSLNLMARAGCGKTSTLIALTKALIDNAVGRVSIFLGAYNKAIADEIGVKLAKLGIEDWKQVDGRWIAPRAVSSTMHSAGIKAFRKLYPKVQVERHKLQHLVDDAVKVEGQKYIEAYRGFITHLVSLAKQRAFGVLVDVEDDAEWNAIIDHFGLAEEQPAGIDVKLAIKLAKWLYQRSLETCKDVIDYDDMILAPLYFNANLFTYDWVFIDEAQDTNPARRALAKRMMKRGGRLIAVGDPAQAIYGFTGADSDSMPILAAELESATLPLTVTYRCPKNVVRMAQQWVPDITAHESAPEGVVRTILFHEIFKETLTASDAVLCRNTMPVVELAYALIRRGVACQVEGRDIAAGILGVVAKWKVVKLDALVKHVQEWQEREVKKLMEKKQEGKAAKVEDQAETILVIAQQLMSEGKNEVGELVAFIKRLFGDTPDGERPKVLTLCTVHKSKGREWKRVFLLGRKRFMPSVFAVQDWQVEQEMNLMYIAVTRAQHELVEVDMGERPPKRF
jgi:DNA helicase II / ATP-dependent DNA helicase PcrA